MTAAGTSKRLFVMQLILFASVLSSDLLHAADREEAVRWRHEGLLIDARDILFANGHLAQEPWKTAWEAMQTDSRLPERVVKRQLIGDSALDEAIAAQMAPDAAARNATPERWLHVAMAYETLRGSPAVTDSERAEWLEWLQKTHFLHAATSAMPESELIWIGVEDLCLGVILENEKTFKMGEDLFLEFLRNRFQDNGAPQSGNGSAWTLDEQLRAVSAMTVMAEIGNHHGDLFYGNDLYHASFGPKNLHRVCAALFERIENEGRDSVRNWGWLELAYKTYGDPEWGRELEKRRPVFDPLAGGPATLMFARSLPEGTPDFGKADDGFARLFNGRDLSGWQMSSRWYEIDPEDFYWEGDVIRTKGARDHWLMSDRMYDRFALRLEYRIGKGSNSGILIWAPIPGRPSKTGFEVQLLDDAGQPPKKDSSGALYEVLPPAVNAQKPAGEWNELEIVCNSPRLKVRLNGTVVQDVNLDENPLTQGRRRRGHIGLQDHAHRVAFRNVRLKILEEGEGIE